MPARSLRITPVQSPLKRAFTISRGSKTHAATVRVEVAVGSSVGRGECVPYARYGETVESVVETIETVGPAITDGAGCEELSELLAPGAARCALDCALWDLEAKETGVPVWRLAGLPEPIPLETAETLSMAEPDEMAAAAADVPGRLLKLKCGGERDLDRLEAVYEARPDARLIVDGNEGLDAASLGAFAERAAKLGVTLIEQPLKAGADDSLQRGGFDVPVCADESAHTSEDIEKLAQHYDAVNVKLDKTGGLTEAIKMVRAARERDMIIMVGCMVSGSLSMAPAMLLAQLADYADLDGPIWLRDDIADGLTFADGTVSPPTRSLWG